MGRLLRLEPCPVCNYHVEGVLHHGNSTRTRMFIFFRYVLAQCADCHEVISALVPTPEYDLPQILEAAEQDIQTLQERLDQGDAIARRLLPLHQLALLEDESLLEGMITAECTACGSLDVTLFPQAGGDDGEHFEDGTTFLACPRCAEGQLWVRTVGHWDELDSGL